jgi:AcrR family transcriptional regulator
MNAKAAGSHGTDDVQLRRDAAANRDRVLAAAVTTVLRDGPKVPMATIAAHAGVGIGTLYRRYPTREALLAALEERAYQIVLSTATAVESLEEPGIESIARFLEQTIEHRCDLVLPMHGAPASLDAGSAALRSQISEVLQRVIERGQRDGSVRADVTSVDIIIAGAMLAQPLAAVSDWDRIARRHKALFLSGIATAAAKPMSEQVVSRADLEAAFVRSSSAPTSRPGCPTKQQSSGSKQRSRP